MHCDVVIPVHNAASLTAVCLEELFQHHGSILGTVVVVNDGSGEGTASLLDGLQERFGFERVDHDEARGFAAACNAGAGQTTGDLVLFLNTDCFLPPGSLANLIQAVQADPAIGLASPLSNNSPIGTCRTRWRISAGSPWMPLRRWATVSW
jgi:GT2 family glycosyltransferase